MDSMASRYRRQLGLHRTTLSSRPTFVIVVTLIVIGAALTFHLQHVAAKIAVLQQGAASDSNVMVEFGAPGQLVALRDALRIGHEAQHSSDDDAAMNVAHRMLAAGSAPSITSESEASRDAVRWFVAIPSHCCSDAARRKRDAIRRTWKHDLSNAVVKFFVSQPANETDNDVWERSIAEEIRESNDIVVVPGADMYANLRFKMLHMLAYAMQHPARWTHYLKVDDDCFVRMEKLTDALKAVDMSGITARQRYRMMKVYMGAVEIDHGFWPIRDPKSKWYISYEDLPKGETYYGRKYAAGWAYVLSRDVCEGVLQRVHMYEQKPSEAPRWWRVLQWEDVIVGLTASEFAPLRKSAAFKPAWYPCDDATGVKHLDVDAPALQQQLYDAQVSGAWQHDDVTRCTSGSYTVGDYWSWLSWRNHLPGIAPV